MSRVLEAENQQNLCFKIETDIAGTKEVVPFM
jgi:hypothetical protein